LDPAFFLLDSRPLRSFSIRQGDTRTDQPKPENTTPFQVFQGILPLKIHPLISEDTEIMRESETIVSRKTLSMRGLFDELLYSLNVMTFE
jgi:hypothetical protein